MTKTEARRKARLAAFEILDGTDADNGLDGWAIKEGVPLERRDVFIDEFRKIKDRLADSIPMIRTPKPKP